MDILLGFRLHQCCDNVNSYRLPFSVLGFKPQQKISFLGLVGFNHLLGEMPLQSKSVAQTTTEINGFSSHRHQSNVFSISKWHCTPSVTKLICFKWFNRLFTIWYMASCHPCDISVFYNRLVPNAITVYSHYSLGGKIANNMKN